MNDKKEFIRRWGDSLTAAQIAAALGITRSVVYRYAVQLGINLKNDSVGRPAKDGTRKPYQPRKIRQRTDFIVCENRPKSCFTCPYSECLCTSGTNKAESAYLFIGMQSEEKRKERKRRDIQPKKLQGV